MTNAHLQAWLERDDREVIDAVKADVREHVERLRARGDHFYGYAILPGESYALDELVVAFNRESDLDPQHATDTYYRFSVDEWANYEHGELRSADELIAARNARFKDLHIKDEPNSYSLDEQEMAHIAKLHDSILTALVELRRDGLFEGDNHFLVMWIPDSDHPIIYQSAKALNSSFVYDSFMSTFG